MPYYEYEYIVQNLIDILNEKKEAEEGANDPEAGKMQAAQMMRNASSMMPSGMGNLGKGGMPSMPSMPSFPGIPSSMKI